MRHSQLINYTLYQTGWFACVLGASWQRPLTGLAIATGLTAIHLALVPNRATEIRLVLLTASIGTIIEVGQLAAGTYRFASGMLVDWLPPLWLLAMWAQFATTFRFSLRRVMVRPQWAAVFGALGGPTAFLAGERLGAVTLLPPLASGLLRLSLAWAVGLLILSVVVRVASAEPTCPKYRWPA
jgi:Protein of unknown function (DUF2878)